MAKINCRHTKDPKKTLRINQGLNVYVTPYNKQKYDRLVLFRLDN